MADISTWSPVDASNNQPPPDGFPEGMAPSGLNNGTRAMMGATRRWYDTVTAQFTAVNAQFGNYLPLAGGTLTGTLNGTTVTAGQLTSTGNIGASGSITATLDVNAGRNVGVTGNISANGSIGASLDVTAGRNMSAAAGTVYANAISCTGSIGAAAVTATGNLSAAGYICDGVTVLDTGGGNPLLYKAGGVWGIQLSSTGTFYDNNGHTFRNNGGANTFTIDASGNVNATTQVQGGSLYARGDITGVGTVSGAIVYGTSVSGGLLYSTGGVDGNTINCRSTADFAGMATFAGGITSHDGYSNLNAIQPRADHDGFVGRATFSYDSMSCYNYITVSDRNSKRDIETPTGCLDLVRAIPPRTYRWADREDETRHWGLVAQEVGEAAAAAGRDFPGHLTDPETGQQRLVINDLLALLWGAVRELSEKLATMEEANAR